MSIDPVVTDATTGGNFSRYAYANNNPYKYIDPDGRFGVAGFIVGAAFEAVAQYAVTGQVSDGKAIFVAGLVGTVTGGIGGAAAKAAMLGSISAKTAVAATSVASSAAAVTGKIGEAAWKGESASAGDRAIAAVGGAIGGAAGATVANSAAAALGRAASSMDNVVAGIAATTSGAIRGGGPVQVSTTIGSVLAQKTIDGSAAVIQKQVEEKVK